MAHPLTGPTNSPRPSAPAELDIIRKEYVDCTNAYGCLGVLRVAVGTHTYSYLVLVTECQSIGKVSEGWAEPVGGASWTSRAKMSMEAS